MLSWRPPSHLMMLGVVVRAATLLGWPCAFFSSPEAVAPAAAYAMPAVASRAAPVAMIFLFMVFLP